MFTSALSTANYVVSLSFADAAAPADGSTLWVTDKSLTGFTIHAKDGFGAALLISVDWIAIPRN